MRQPSEVAAKCCRKIDDSVLPPVNSKGRHGSSRFGIMGHSSEYCIRRTINANAFCILTLQYGKPNALLPRKRLIQLSIIFLTECIQNAVSGKLGPSPNIRAAHGGPFPSREAPTAFDCRFGVLSRSSQAALPTAAIGRRSATAAVPLMLEVQILRPSTM
jgi:hypothetical protein